MTIAAATSIEGLVVLLLYAVLAIVLVGCVYWVATQFLPPPWPVAVLVVVVVLVLLYLLDGAG